MTRTKPPDPITLAAELLTLHATIPEDPDVGNVAFEEKALALARAVVSQDTQRRRRAAAEPHLYGLDLETPSFRFRAYGSSDVHTRAVMARAIRKHCQQTGADRAYFAELLANYPPRRYDAGTAFRDDYRLV